MELGLLAISAATLLAKGFVDAAAADTGKGVWSVTHRLYDLVKSRLAPIPEAREALVQVESHPTDRGSSEQLAMVIKLQAEHDEDFRRELEGMVSEADRYEPVAEIVNQFFGDVRIGKQVNIGDVHGSVSF